VKREDEVHDLIDFVRANQEAFHNASFHVYAENDQEKIQLGYPQNILRNIALEQSATDYFVALDADLFTEIDRHKRLVNLLRSREDIKKILLNRFFFSFCLPLKAMRRCQIRSRS